MDFLSIGQFDNKHEKRVWDSLKEAFKTEPGNAWHNHPITTMKANPVVPDIVLFHPEWGLNVIEVKGFTIDQIEAIEGFNWFMTNFYEDVIQPLQQSRNHMFSIRDRLKGFHYGILIDEEGELKATTNHYVALPLIDEAAWQDRFADHPNVDRKRLLFGSDLSPEGLRIRFITSSKKQKPLSDEERDAVIASIAGSDALQRKPLKPAKSDNSRYALMRKAHDQMINLDDVQRRIGIQIPEGPQRIRGLAGTGKTVVLAQKIAHMHLQHPDWRIAYTFYTRSLYGQIRELITRFVRSLSDNAVDEPNWDNLLIMHCWGGKYLPGFYYDMCERTGAPFRNFSEAREYFFAPRNRLFELCCNELLSEYRIPVLYDAILIDEAQDIGPNYAQLCYHSSKKPKRVIWAYDEVQSLDVLDIPSPDELFGREPNGQPRVTLSGPAYNGEVERDETLSICYRNPRPILVAAHAFGLGLHRKPTGPVQFIPSVQGWNDIGYEIEFEKGKSLTRNQPLETGNPYILHRPQSFSPHYLEDKLGYHEIIKHKSFASREEELTWIAEDIAKNVRQEEVPPHDIAIITLDTRDKDRFEHEYDFLRRQLKVRQIECVVLSEKGEKDRFTRKNQVTFTGTFRAKGNEAWLVYVYGFENADSKDSNDPIRQRNIAFTAMTRSRGWLMLTGVGSRAQELFQEIDSILEDTGRVRFRMPDMSKIDRYLQLSREREERQKAVKAEEATKRAFTALAEVDPEQLPDDIKELIRKLGNKFAGEDQ